ncbi:MAG: hypothetical protein HYV95_01035 [Opitutae bacterium]|nr:hypothetical protein [Opitutae bacterium]
MKRIRIYRHPDCAKCARYAKMHRALDWLNRIVTTTGTPPSGPLRLGQIVVEEVRTGEIHRGAEAFALICRQVPLYWPFLPLLAVPALRRAIAREINAGEDESCQSGATVASPR